MSNIIKQNIYTIVKSLDVANKLFSKQELNDIIATIKKKYMNDYNSLDDIDKILEELFMIKYIIDLQNIDNLDISNITENNIIENYGSVVKQISIPNLTNYDTIETRDMLYTNLLDTMENMLDSTLKKKYDHYKYLMNLPQPVQKSKEWYDQRNNIITASSGANAIGESKYGTRDEYLMEKIGLEKNFKENEYVYHGKKYEKTAIMIYEYINNSKIGEFGLILYQNDNTDIENINYIGASPDGINMALTLDGKPNKLANVMVEIKCPITRKIEIIGDIDGTICPHVYYIQCQLQLASCKCDSCHFWQCNIVEINETTWNNIADTYNECVYTVEQGIIKKIDPMITRGMIIQLFPINRDNIPQYDKTEWYAKHIYPSNLYMTKSEYNDWFNYMQANWKKLYPDLADKYKFIGPRYWKLENCHNVLIERDIKWFNSKVPLFKAFWTEVLLYRNNIDKKNEFIKLINDKKNKNKEKAEKAKITRSKNKLSLTSPINSESSIVNIIDNTQIFEKPKITKQNILNDENLFLSES